ncbi:hypothetical protein ACEPAH_3561 [Sanghuangporus vaninii]
MINTPITRLLGITTPIIAAPMAGASGGELAARVSRAGGFGLLQAGYLDVVAFQKELDLARSILQEDSASSEAGSDRSHESLSIGVGFLAWILDKPDGKVAELLSIALEAHVAAVWFAFGNDLGKWVRVVRISDEKKSQPRKTKVFILVNSLDEARRAVYEWDADVLVAQGIEAGGHGHGGAPPLLDFVPEILNEFNSNSASQHKKPCPPVIAAGGLSTGSQIAAILTLGASGVALGTRFLLTPESLYTDAQKAALLAAHGTPTVRSMAFDAMRGTLEWPEGVDGRALKNKIVELYKRGEDAEKIRELYRKATKEGDPDGMLIWSGTGVGLVNKIEPATDLVARLHEEIASRLKEVGTFV